MAAVVSVAAACFKARQHAEKILAVAFSFLEQTGGKAQRASFPHWGIRRLPSLRPAWEADQVFEHQFRQQIRA